MGGVDECQEIPLDVAQMKQIIEAVNGKALPQTTGFFFGQSYGTPEEAAEDIAIFEKAITWLEAKTEKVYKSVIYQAFW